MHQLLRTALFASAAATWACNGSPLEVPATPDGVGLDDARLLYTEFCPDAELLADGADPEGLDALYVYDVAADPLVPGGRARVDVTVVNLGDVRNTLDWRVRVTAGAEPATAAVLDAGVDPCGRTVLRLEVPVGAGGRVTTRAQVALVDGDRAGHRVTVDLPVDIAERFARLCSDGPLDVAAETTDLEDLHVLGISANPRFDLLAVDVVNLGDAHFGADFGASIDGLGLRRQSEVRMRGDRPGIAPCGRERMSVAIADLGQWVGQGVSVTLVGAGEDAAHRGRWRVGSE